VSTKGDARAPADPEYDALVMQVASWVMRKSQANEYVPSSQLMARLAVDVVKCTVGAKPE